MKIAGAIEVNTFLQVIDILHNNISDDGAIVISNSLKNNKTLQSLDMSSNKVTDFGAIRIGEAIEVNLTLQKLNLSHNKITDNQIVAMSECLKKNKTLQEFRISWNKGYLVLDGTIQLYDRKNKEVCDGELTLIAALLHRNTTVVTLNLSCNDITDDGAIAECLKNNCTLQELDLSENSLTVKGIKIILYNNTQSSFCVRELKLSHNLISKSGMMVIVGVHEILSYKPIIYMSFYEICNTDIGVNNTIKTTLVCLTNDSSYLEGEYYKKDVRMLEKYKAEVISCCLREDNFIKHLYLSHCRITYKGLGRIGDALTINNSLQSLDVSGNKISDVGAISFSECFKSNSTLQLLTCPQTG